ncbi:MAG: DUF1566 domain-containing protein, partial [Campylobacterota bacterium]|nr:DUF1566 domain-containing protein [Campylobacterota bacterium]
MQKYFILFLLFPFLLFSSSDTLKWDSAIYDGDRSYSQYTKNTIKDNLTDLIWEKGRSSYGLMWGEAEAYCINLELDGFDDWRLPYYEELYYLADRKKSHPAIDSKYFDEEDGEWYWSRTLYKFESETAWLISFTSGYDSYYGKTSLNFARCVRDIEKVEKKNRDLIWQDSSQIVQKDWKNA